MYMVRIRESDENKLGRLEALLRDWKAPAVPEFIASREISQGDLDALEWAIKELKND